PCNFRLRIDGLDCTRINKVEAFTIKQLAIGDVDGDGLPDVARVCTDLVVTMPYVDALPVLDRLSKPGLDPFHRGALELLDAKGVALNTVTMYDLIPVAAYPVFDWDSFGVMATIRVKPVRCELK